MADQLTWYGWKQIDDMIVELSSTCAREESIDVRKETADSALENKVPSLQSARVTDASAHDCDWGCCRAGVRILTRFGE